MNFKDFLTKLQSLPEKQKKIILWTIVAVLAITMGFFWLKSAAYRLSKFGEDVKKIELPPLEMQKIEFSATSENNIEE